AQGERLAARDAQATCYNVSQGVAFSPPDPRQFAVSQGSCFRTDQHGPDQFQPAAARPPAVIVCQPGAKRLARMGPAAGLQPLLVKVEELIQSPGPAPRQMDVAKTQGLSPLLQRNVRP